MARPKRKVPDTVESTTSKWSKRNVTTPGETHQKPVAERRKNPKRTCREAVKNEVQQSPVSIPRKRRAGQKAVDQSPTTHPAATFKTPKNPRATFEGLPAELRLMIYDVLSKSTMIHVHMTRADGKPIRDDDICRTKERFKFSWTPCRGTNPKSSLLCANPKWSGMCKEGDRCTYKIDARSEPLGYWALAACNKALRQETKRLSLLNTVVSIHPDDVEPWIDHLCENAPNYLDQLRHVTLAEPDIFRYNYHIMRVLSENFPELQSVGLQCQSPIHSWGVDFDGSQWRVADDEWDSWLSIDLSLLFDPSVTIALEAMVWRSTNELMYWCPGATQNMTAIRVFGWGQEGVFEKGGPEIMRAEWIKEVQVCTPLAEPKRNAKWRAWWRTEDTQGFSW